MPPLPKKNSSGDRGLPVAEHCKKFLEKVLRGGYGTSEQDNQRVAGENFVETMNKLAEVGNKEDIRIPLRVIRDEIGRVYNGGDPKRKATEIDILFGLYDTLERASQDNVKTGRGQDAAKAEAILEGLRERFSRLVIGETWDQYPELKLMALKRIYGYSVREGGAFRSRTKFSAGSGGSNLPTLNSKKSSGVKGMLGLGVSKSMSLASTMTRDVTGGPPADSWQGVLSNDLGKCAASKLIPTIKLLLMENAAGGLSAQSGGSVTMGYGVGEADAGHFDEPISSRTSSASKPPLPSSAAKAVEKAAENGSSTLPRSPPKATAKTDLTPAASDASAVEMPQAVTSAAGAAPGRGISEVDLDDLLGLDDSPDISSPVMPLSPVASPTAPSPASAQPVTDPFQSFMDSPRAAQGAGPSSSMAMFGSAHPVPALPTPAAPSQPAPSQFGSSFGGVAPTGPPATPANVAPTQQQAARQVQQPAAAASPFSAPPAAAAGGAFGGDPFGMSAFGGLPASGSGGFEENAFGGAAAGAGGPQQLQHQQQLQGLPPAAPSAAAGEPSSNPFAPAGPTTHPGPQQGAPAAMSGWGLPAASTPATGAGAASGSAFDFSSFGQNAFGTNAQPPQAGSKGTTAAPASSAPNPWGQNAF